MLRVASREHGTLVKLKVSTDLKPTQSVRL